MGNLSAFLAKQFWGRPTVLSIRSVAKVFNVRAWIFRVSWDPFSVRNYSFLIPNVDDVRNTIRF